MRARWEITHGRMVAKKGQSLGHRMKWNVHSLQCDQRNESYFEVLSRGFSTAKPTQCLVGALKHEKKSLLDPEKTHKHVCLSMSDA